MKGSHNMKTISKTWNLGRSFLFKATQEFIVYKNADIQIELLLQLRK